MMVKQPKQLERSAADFLPKNPTINSLKAAAQKCKGCHLYKNATQTVFGEGKENSSLMVVGEIPGDKEDEEGEPFVGPAGVFLRKTMESSGLDPEDVYFTNVVKHFKFIYSHRRRLHRSPIGSEIKACIPWLDEELKIIKPEVILCLGAVAAKAIVDKNFHLREQHGEWHKKENKISILVTYHPSAVLRAPDEVRATIKKEFFKDIKKVALFLQKTKRL